MSNATLAVYGRLGSDPRDREKARRRRTGCCAPGQDREPGGTVEQCRVPRHPVCGDPGV